MAMQKVFTYSNFDELEIDIYQRFHEVINIIKLNELSTEQRQGYYKYILDYTNKSVLENKYLDVIEFIKTLVSVWKNATKETRFIHYYGPIEIMKEMINKNWYSEIDSAKKLYPQCKCKDASGKHNHEHTIVSTILTERSIQNKRAYCKKTDETFKLNSETGYKCKNINNLSHFINTALYIMCSISTTNNKDHKHYDNLPFQINYGDKRELIQYFLALYNLEQEFEEYKTKNTMITRLNKKRKIK